MEAFVKQLSNKLRKSIKFSGVLFPLEGHTDTHTHTMQSSADRDPRFGANKSAAMMRSMAHKANFLLPIKNKTTKFTIHD